jgi:hypothetical protein
MERVVDLALSFDAVIFGGYVRDVVICGGKEFNDIDILWPINIQHTFDVFLRVLSNEPWVTSFKTCRVKNSRRYGVGYDIEKVVINKNLKLDCVLYPGYFSSWLRQKDCDFTCNLFYMTREIYLAIRYVPDELKNVPNPTHECYEMTRQKKFMTIVSREGDSAWARAAGRALKLVQSGWTLDGEFIRSHYLNGLTRTYQFVSRSVHRMNQIIADRAVGVIADEIGENCADRVRRRLFDQDSESLSERESVASNEENTSENL